MATYNASLTECSRCGVLSIILKDVGVCFVCSWEEKGEDTRVFRELQKVHRCPFEKAKAATKRVV